MKKNYYSLFAAATMLMAATSCSQVEDFEQSSNEMTTFKVQLESGAQSRAYGEGKLVDNLYYEVYHDGTCIFDEEQEFVPGTSAISVTLPLVKGKQYDVIFWAQKKEGSIYNLNDEGTAIKKVEDFSLTEISATYSGSSNQEAYDAFFGALKGYTAGNAAQTVELYRPFAQLNIATTAEDLANAKETAADLSKSEVTVKNIANKFNALTGVASGDVEATFGAAAWNEAETKEINGKIYTILAMNYLLVPGQDTEAGKAKATVEVSAAFKDDVNTIATIDVPNVPIQRNYRTNIYGNILTGQNVFNVEIKPGFDDETSEEYEKWYDIIKVAQEGGTITLTEDVTMPSPLVFTKDAQINLNGFTFKGGIEDSPEATGTDIAAITIEDGANLIITGGNNGKIEGTEYGVYVRNGSVTIKDGNYTAGTSAVQVMNGTANIEGGNFSCTSTDKRYVINCIDANYNNGTAIVNITGGTFKDFNPANNAAEGQGTNFVAEGYVSTPNSENTEWTVSVDATTLANDAEKLKEMLAKPNISNIYLAANTTYEGTFHVERNVTIKSIDAANMATIKGRVHISSVSPTFENVKFDRNETDSNGANITTSNALQYKAVVMIYGDQTNTIKFEGCNFYNNNGTHKSAITNVACDLIIDNCYFEGRSSAIYSQANLSITNSTFNYTGGNNVIASINGCGVNGGKFIFKNNTITNKIFALSQFLSTVGFGNGTYHFDVQGNTGAGFDYYFLNESRVTNKTFAEGSETF